MRLMVLAGGFGTRLKTAIGDVPKALASVGGIPFLQLQIEHWINQGLLQFTFLLHHQSDQIITFLQAQQSARLKGCQVDWIIEAKPMDTGGALAHGVRELNVKGDFLMTNADTWLGSGVRELMLACSPTMAVVNLADVSRYGQVIVDHGSRVTSFVEKNDRRESGWINAGLCRLNAELFADWDGHPFSLERKLLAGLVQSRSLKAIALETDFIDIGVPEDYHRFCRWIEQGRETPLCD